MVWYKTPILVCIVACIIPNIGGFLGSLITDTSEDSWYGGLFKPTFNPPNWVSFRRFALWCFLWYKKHFRKFSCLLNLNVRSTLMLKQMANQIFIRSSSFRHGRHFISWLVLPRFECGTKRKDSRTGQRSLSLSSRYRWLQTKINFALF